MLKKTIGVLSAVVLWAICAEPVMAALSVGATVNGGSGQSKIYSESVDLTGLNNDRKNPTNKDYAYIPSIGGGLVIDYEKPDGKYIHRYSITLDQYSISKNSRQDLYRFGFTNTFGFVVLKNDYCKFWLGPQIGIRYIFGKTNYYVFDNNRTNTFILQPQLLPYIYWNALYNYRKATYNMAGLDLGIIAGVNFDIKKYVTLSASGGLRYGATVGGMSFRRGGLFENNKLVYSHGYEGFLEFSILYQFNTRQPDKQEG